MKNINLLMFLLLVIGFAGLGSLAVELSPLDYEINDKTYIENFNNVSSKYGNELIDGFKSFLNKIDSVFKTINKAIDGISNAYDKITYVPDWNLPGSHSEWQNASFFQKLWWTVVGQFKKIF